ncbi:hypothetical protein LCGC14_0919030 [marine sediment metagenome]|uniref:Uncharacterized protein n=1 Tax=marine sediment metagenome TaxID=412755 RepID=A0A0F9PC23_9ZZZZ
MIKICRIITNEKIGKKTNFSPKILKNPTTTNKKKKLLEYITIKSVVKIER